MEVSKGGREEGHEGEGVVTKERGEVEKHGTATTTL